MSCHVMSCHMSCHIICHVMSYVMSYHMSCQVICHKSIKFIELILINFLEEVFWNLLILIKNPYFIGGYYEDNPILKFSIFILIKKKLIKNYESWKNIECWTYFSKLNKITVSCNWTARTRNKKISLSSLNCGSKLDNKEKGWVSLNSEQQRKSKEAQLHSN